MNVTVSPGRISGTIAIPGSKSHTIRALLIAALANGSSNIRRPLRSADTLACIDILTRLGVEIEDDGDAIRVEGRGTTLREPGAALDCANSGTTLYLALGIAALQSFPVTFTGDDQLQRRSAGPLLAALEAAGASIDRRNGECVPLSITGPIARTAGPRPVVTVSCPTSQYLSSLLIAAPLTAQGLDVRVPLLNERPYVELTLSWLDRQGVAYRRDGWSRFDVDGGREYTAFDAAVPGDFSSATFFLAAAAATGSEVELTGLDMNDSQGDKAVVGILEELGATVTVNADSIRIRGPERLRGGRVDLNAIPDALPALALLGTCCSTPLELVNVPQAREKETDRIAVMARVISTLGGRADELACGIVVHPGRLTGGTVDSSGDHRVAMAAAIAGLFATSEVTVTRAQVAGITFPDFFELLAECGARVKTEGSS